MREFSDHRLENHLTRRTALQVGGTHHTYQQPGDYIVSVQRSRNDGVTATTRLHVRVTGE
jgi:hypothetical protein